jgi:hypothetical protein
MILIYTDELNPRIKYISRLIFSTILKNEVSFTSKASDFLKSELPKVNYSCERFNDEFYIKPHHLLYCKALIKPNIQPVWYEGEKYFFESSADSEFPFDPLAASFYLVTRYEEYLNSTPDKFHRYQAKESILMEYNLLNKPVVNIWAGMLAKKLKARFPRLKFPEPEFQFLSTIDIDNAWAYAHKGPWRNIAACTRQVLKGNFGEVKKRIRVWCGKEADPYDTYDFIDRTFQGNEDKVLFFFLLGDYAHYDKNLSPRNKHFRKLISGTALKYQVGIHPSYASSKKNGAEKLKKEIERLEAITGSEIKKSRQHFLRLRFPRTYRRLIKAGISEDYTMGYPSHTGFRAGICTPCYFYDLKKEAATSLKIIPFQVMDVTLRNYMGLPPAEAMQEIESLMREVKNAGGTFVSVWHNETLNGQGDWKGYREVFMRMNQLGFEWTNV